MTWQLRVDERSCMASGVCASLAPELFQLETDTARPVAPEVEPDEMALDAADSCPAMAITVTESGTEIGPRP
jgi:ferredoxin